MDEIEPMSVDEIKGQVKTVNGKVVNDYINRLVLAWAHAEAGRLELAHHIDRQFKSDIEPRDNWMSKDWLSEVLAKIGWQLAAKKALEE